MIVGTLCYSSRYSGLGEGVQKALKFLRSRDIARMPVGRHIVDSEKNIYAEVVETQTIPPGAQLFEAHARCIDLHLTLEGEEWYGYAPVNNLKAFGDYDSERDVALYEGEGVYFQVPSGQFAIFFPDDSHKPCVTFRNPEFIRKLIVKIGLDQ